MSEQQSKPITTTVTAAATSLRDAWGEPISAQRQAELQGYLDQWQAETDHGERKGPFNSIVLTGADVSWLIEQSGRNKYLYVPNLHLEGADLRGAHLEGARLIEAHLEGANLAEAHLEGRSMPLEDLERIHQWIPQFPEDLAPVDLRLAFLSEATTLNDICLGDATHGYIRTADVRWGGVNLAIVDLPPAYLLGDERAAYQAKDSYGDPKDREHRLANYRAAVRANRQLAVALQNIGLNEEAARFAYRAQFVQQKVLLRQRKYGAYLLSRFLDGIAGYGYKPVRGVIAYVVVILGFAVAYGLATNEVLTFGLPPSSIHPLQWYEALVLSISAFHGRGFFQPVQSLGDPVAILAAAEAIIGLLIEISFIATFTQRFFGSK
jgi:hypothetical protein